MIYINLFDHRNGSKIITLVFIPINPNSYNSNVIVLGILVQTEINPAEKVKAVVGVSKNGKLRATLYRLQTKVGTIG